MKADPRPIFDGAPHAGAEQRERSERCVAPDDRPEKGSRYLSFPRFRSGFTLIELILVLIILTIVAAVIAPSIRGFAAAHDKENLATLFVSLANYARTQSASEGRTYRLNLDTTQNAVWLTVQDGASFSAPSSDFGQRFTTTDGVKIETDMTQRQDGTYVEFTSGGRCEPAKIWITDKLNNTTEVAAASATELFRVVPQAEMTR